MPAALETLAAFGAARPALLIKLDQQKLYLIDNNAIRAEYPISSSRYGTGGEDGSLCTPLGVHRIAEKIGASCAPGEIIKARVPTGETAEIIQEPRHGEADVITSRILWLEGLEEGRNRGKGVDSYRRYIYIHGTAEEGLIGRPASIGCVRMTNFDIIELYESVSDSMPVNIVK
jgi:hypothetical protein